VGSLPGAKGKKKKEEPTEQGEAEEKE
jgi:hypothetical protein